VVNTKNGRSVIVRVNDRINERTQAEANYVIDLSRGSVRALGTEGVGSVALYETK
jgi:rare lipoprotein A (peptidoglycan hydrolase)